MKTNINRFLCAAAIAVSGLFAVSCNYLDVDPELGITEDEVFSTYENANKFVTAAYETTTYSVTYCSPLYMDMIRDLHTPFVGTTDAADVAMLTHAQNYFKQGILSQDIIEYFTTTNRPMLTALFAAIRIANLAIEKFPQMTNGTERERNDYLGHAYFIRGICHFSLCRYFGGMPYLDHSFGADDSWDLPRESAHDTYLKAAEDLKTAADYFRKAGYMRRNTPDNLVPSRYLIFQASGCTALAARARCLLYAASPLNNQLGDEDWKAAADACGEALKVALENQFTLEPLGTYYNNYTGAITTNEVLWGYRVQLANSEASNMTTWLAYCQSKQTNANGPGCGLTPTQNFVDRFETADGYLLRTPEERAIAQAAGSYNEQQPYANRDPRMDLVIVHDGTKSFQNLSITSEGGTFNIYYDPATKTWPATTINGTVMVCGHDWGAGENTSDNPGYRTNTGYYCRRNWDGSYSGSYWHQDPMFRLGEMYLAYAEAVNEAYGPSGTAGGVSLTALQAMNLVRARVNMPAARSEYVSDKDKFREYIRNERCIELAYESNHYWFDIRRWKTAPELMSQTLYGMYIEKCDVSAEYPEGRKYIRRALPDNRQCVWRDYMYVLPFPDKLANTMTNFKNNQKWQ